MINIDLSDIQAFIVTADLGSISAAAQHLGHLQSNMTVKIKKIENHYKHALFLRKARGVELTPKGKIIYQHYKKLLVIWDETERAIINQNNVLRFGINLTMRGNQFAYLVQEIHQQYDDLSFTFKTGNTKTLEQEVIDGVLDFAYIYGEKNNKNLNYLAHGEEELVLIGQNLQHDLAKNLASHKILCLSKDCCYMTILDNLYQQFTLPLPEKIYISELEDLIALSQLGLGIALIARSLTTKYEVKQYIEIPEQYRSMKGYIISRKQHQFSPLEQQFIEASRSKSLL